MALRFFMGIFEAGFGPGVPYLLSFFYRRHELGLRCGLFFAAAPLANCFAGALAYGITSGHNEAIANWRVLFLVEGLPVIVCAALAWFFLPDSPQAARFLTEEEREVARARAIAQSGEAERDSKVNWKEVFQTLLDPKAWLFAVCFLSISSSGDTANLFASSSCTLAAMSASLLSRCSCPPSSKRWDSLLSMRRASLPPHFSPLSLSLYRPLISLIESSSVVL